MLKSFPLQLLVLTVAHWLAAVVGLQWAMIGAAGSPVWPAAGVALAGLLLGGIRLWPAILIGRFGAALAVGSTHPVSTDLLIAGGNTLSFVVAVLFLQRVAKLDPRLATVRDVLWFAAGAGLAALIAASIGTLALRSSGGFGGAEAVLLWSNWVFGNFVGTATVAPAILAWISRGRWGYSTGEALHFAVALLATTAVGYLMFIEDVGLRSWLLFPVLIWSASAFYVRGAALALLITSLLAVWGATLGSGPIADVSSESSIMLMTQQFVSVAALTVLILAATAEERQRRLQTELSSVSRNLDAVLNNTRMGVFLMDDRQHCVYANKAAEELTGFSLEEMQGRPLHDVIHHRKPDGSHYPIEECPIDRAFPERAQMDGEELFVAPDGSLYPVAFTASPLLNDTGEAVGTIIEARQIAEEKAREAALQELHHTLERRVQDALAERRVFADVMESATAAILVCDLDLKILAINHTAVDQFKRVYGSRPKPGDYFLDLIPASEERSRVQTKFEAALGGQEVIIVDEFGAPGWERVAYEVRFSPLRDEEGRQIGIVQTAYDVSDRVRAEARLAEAEEARRQADALYRAYFENTPEALFVVRVEPEGFFIEEMNPAHEAGFGAKLEDVQGRRIDEILPHEVARRVVARYRQVVQTGEIITYREVFHLTGSPQHWDTSLVPVRDEQGSVVRLMGSSRNVTGQVFAEEALRHSQKMEAMGNLTGGVAHDFNNLLTPIVGSLDMLQRKRTQDEREKRLIAGALQSAEKAKTLVQRLLSFARRQPLQPVAVDVSKLIFGMSELVSSTIGPQVKVVLNAPDVLPPAKADPNQLEMALLNLCVNARDAMPEGGTLRISASAETVRRENSSALAPGSYIRLSVTDTGAGMDEETLQRAVEPFFSTKGIGRGTGLGLSMAHGLAAQLGGALLIHSSVGFGTNVELWLPQSHDVLESADAPTETAEFQLERGTALLVDDEELVRASTADMLEELGYTVEAAQSAEEALRMIDDGLLVDLVVTDHLMPGMTGTQLAYELRARWPGMPLLVVSGYAEVDGIAPELPRLVKPYRQAELAAKLAELGAEPLRDIQSS